MAQNDRLERGAAHEADEGDCRGAPKSCSNFAKIESFLPPQTALHPLVPSGSGVENSKKGPVLHRFRGKVLASRFSHPERNDYCWRKDAARTMLAASKLVRMKLRSRAMVTVKSSQKIFTDSEVANLTGICVEHVHNFAKSRHLGFIARAAEAAGISADQWLFTLSDLMVLVTLFPKCTH